MQVSRAIVGAKSDVLASTLLPIFDSDTPAQYLATLPEASQPTCYWDAIELNNLQKGGYDLLGHRAFWTNPLASQPVIGSANARPAMIFTSVQGDFSVRGCGMPPGFTIFVVAALATGQLSGGKHSSLLQVVDLVDDDQVNLIWDVIATGDAMGPSLRFWRKDDATSAGSLAPGSALPAENRLMLYIVSFDQTTKVSKQYIYDAQAGHEVATFTHGAFGFNRPNAIPYFGSDLFNWESLSAKGWKGPMSCGIICPVVLTDAQRLAAANQLVSYYDIDAP